MQTFSGWSAKNLQVGNSIFSFYFAARGYVLAAFLGVLLEARLQSRASLHWTFLLLVAIGMILRLWAGNYLGSHGNATQAKAPELQLNGPYRFSRNPLYLSNLLVGAGLFLFANCMSAMIIGLAVGLLFIHHALLVKWEERRLHSLWGDAYAVYVRKAPRWFGWPRSPDLTFKKPPVRWNTGWSWQSRNLAYAVLSTILVWGASRWK